ncbi:hypothetical protein EYB26_005108 [Talaromyces marneffei]|uniref:uncharacterized protein n=1 Tax=Talaromyces marneffei TaxID=37727 RepID=UPI0012A998D4|nr:uncharacterized protein EYB26_005108 [Talaromyces marneffei]QGA17437.1 hypothetical protein EYB26_005108 [Talaromyces marneffei]
MLPDDESSSKTRRISRACLQCRARKQRCATASEPLNVQAPCQRCQKYEITCSFQTDTALGPTQNPGPSRVAQLVVELHQKITQHETRISELEKSSSPKTKLVSRGILSLNDAGKAVEIYFTHCHPMAPVLNESLLNTWPNLRTSNPILFLAICSVGLRFWETGQTQSNMVPSTYPRFSELTALLDQIVSKLLLRPTPSDVSLDSILVLLLYAQWMPCNSGNESYQSTTRAEATGAPNSRYNEVSAWAIFGLALRYALLLGLDRAAIAPFHGPIDSITENDVSRLRVWYNLLNCDFNLMLISGLPASVDPAPSAQVAERFASSIYSKHPGDIRVSGLVELVSIVHRAMQSCVDMSGHQLSPSCLRKLNIDLEKWEQTWYMRLRNTESQHNQLPFNSVRSYRLALNSASLGPLLSPAAQKSQPTSRASQLQSLDISLSAAAQMLISLCSDGETYVWDLESQNAPSFPSRPFHVDVAAVRRLYYAVDPTWISYAFAVTFLTLCYIRGVIDEDLQIHHANIASPENTTLLPASSGSIIASLLRLATDVFDSVCSTVSYHPAYEFRAVVHGAMALLLAPGSSGDHGTQEIDEIALQSLLDLINDAGLEWPGNMADVTNDLNGGWEACGLFGM